jgi:glycosyltransferase involved in cell wall biosynthesis
MSDKLVSVIMPVYNAERYLREAINSILVQTYSHFEFIIIDDGSSDNSSDIIKCYRDDRISAYFFNNGGCSRQRNFGISVAKGEVIALMDADDISEPTRIEEQFNFLKSSPDVQIVGTNCLYINDKGERILSKKYPESHEEIEFIAPVLCPICPSSMMTYKKILTDLGGYTEELLVAGDYNLILRLLAKGYSFHNYQKTLYNYRIIKTSLSQTKSEMQKINHYNSSIFYLDHCKHSEKVRHFYNYRRGLLEYYYGEITVARKYLLKALKNKSIPKSRLLRLLITSMLGESVLEYLRKKGVLKFINKVIFKIFNYDLQKMEIKN